MPDPTPDPTPDSMRNVIPGELVSRLRQARRVVVFTGAGVSAESGIPTFRDAMTGLWTRFQAEDLATPDAFRRDPDLAWGWYEWRRMKVMAAQPNPAHRAIAALAHHTPQLTLITQNVDDLHERAGSTDVIHLHGSLHQPRCFACEHPYTFPPEPPEEPVDGRRLPPPRCTHCGGKVRPGVVWFGESLPASAWKAAEAAVAACDLLFSVGTSLLVYPAAELPRTAASRGATVVQVNPQPTPLDRVAQFNLLGAAGALLPQLVSTTWPDSET